MAALFDSRVQYLDTIEPSILFFALGLIFFVAGLLFPPFLLISLAFLVVGATWGWAAKPARRPPELPWISTPGAWCPTCGGPALWMPRYIRWYCNSCSRYLAAEIAPPSQPAWPPE